MSISIMTEVWKIEGISSPQKLVFLSLADNANDQGECYPSMRQIAARTCLSERAVRDAVRALESMGYVKSVSRFGTSSVYYLSTTPAPAAAPARNAPRQQMPPTPAPVAAPPRQEVPPTPASPAPKPSLNRQSNRHLNVKVDLPDWLPNAAWIDWVSHRKAVKAPLTQKAAELCIKKLAKLKAQGNDPVAVIDQSVITGRWTDLYPLKEDPGKPASATQKFDPVAFVNKNRTDHERNHGTIIDI